MVLTLLPSTAVNYGVHILLNSGPVKLAILAEDPYEWGTLWFLGLVKHAKAKPKVVGFFATSWNWKTGRA